MLEKASSEISIDHAFSSGKNRSYFASVIFVTFDIFPYPWWTYRRACPRRSFVNLSKQNSFITRQFRLNFLRRDSCAANHQTDPPTVPSNSVHFIPFRGLYWYTYTVFIRRHTLGVRLVVLHASPPFHKIDLLPSHVCSQLPKIISIGICESPLSIIKAEAAKYQLKKRIADTSHISR